jgi:hypothetical protein
MKQRISHVALIFMSSLFSLLYFLIAAEVLKTSHISLGVFGSVNFVSLIHSILAIFQLGLAVVFYQRMISQKKLKYFIGAFCLVLFVDGLSLVLKKLYPDSELAMNFYYNIHAVVVYMATGILTVFYFLLRPYLSKPNFDKESTNSMNMKNENKDKLKTIFTTSLLLISVLLVVFCFVKQHWKIGGSIFLGALILCGFVYRWSQRGMSKISSRNIWIMYLIGILFGLIGGWYDFFTGFLFFFSAFGILILTGSQREVSMGRLLISIATVCFGFLLLAFHFIFSVE